MLHSELLADEAVLVLAPDGPLAAADFTRVAALVDPYLERHGRLKGLMIHTRHFPGWGDFAALVAHLRFVRDHHRRIERIAAVTDSGVLTVLPRIANHFVAAEVRHFEYADRDAALRWLATGTDRAQG
jgi:SpoIIAA-like